MKATNFILPSAALGMAALSLLSTESATGFTLIHTGLPLAQRDFRVFNNFTGEGANNNTTPDPNFPGALGAVMSIWKGAIEWQSIAHGDGNGDPHQPGGLGSSGGNFDPTYQGEATSPGTINDNVHSMLTGCDGGVLAFTESPSENGWRIRYYSCWNWQDGPGTTLPGGAIDLQGVACHEHGHALGLGHTHDPAATMFAFINGNGVANRSIELDDQLGVQAIYGFLASDKPTIQGVCVQGGQIHISGANFSPTGNQVWFTPSGTGNGNPIMATNVPSNGTEITVAIPAAAGPGDVLVRNGSGHANLSNAWPTDLESTPGGCGGCSDPTNYCSTSPNSVGPGATMDSSGSTSVSAEDFALHAMGAPPGQNGIFYYGPSQVQQPFGNGLRCVGAGGVGTFRLPILQIDSLGEVDYALEWDQPPVCCGNGAITPGSTWNFQFWYRDPAGGGAGFNLSDGLSVTFCP